MEKTDSANIASTLEYYGYSYQGNENGYSIMRDSKGTEIRFSFTEEGVPSKYPTVKVKTSETGHSINSRLKELNFEKSGNSYVRTKNQFSKNKTKCTFGSHSTLIFRKVKN